MGRGGTRELGRGAEGQPGASAGGERGPGTAQAVYQSRKGGYKMNPTDKHCQAHA